jgi:4a-hydroxytetrahydrobiopterin dehydratase
MSLLNSIEIVERLKNLKGWDLSDNQIFKEYHLANFKEALVIVNKIGNEAEAMDHHPDILMHGWNKVKVTISTHSEGGITLKDFELAEKIETIFKS